MQIDFRIGAVAALAIVIAAVSGCSVFRHKNAAKETPPEHVRNAISGVPQRIGFLYRVSADCGTVHAPALLVKQQPQHGTVQFIFAEDNLYIAPCDVQKMQGELVSYTSAPGWVGSDTFSIEALSSGGKSTFIHYTVYVRFTPAPGAAPVAEDSAEVETSDQMAIP